MLGGTFIASELTRQLVSSVLYPLSVLLFFRFFIRDWTRTLAWAAMVMAASIVLGMTSVLIAVNSLAGVRSTLPMLFPIVLSFPVPRPVRITFAGLTLGGALVLGTEQGLAVAVALAVVTVIVAWGSNRRAEWLTDAATIIAIGIVTLAGALVAMGGLNGMRAALDYNFRLVPLDQFWYFGAPPNPFLSTWSVVPRMLEEVPRIPIALLAGVAVLIGNVWLLRREVNRPREREQFAFTVLASYGVISCASLLGSFVPVYVQPLLRVLLLLVAVSLDRVLFSVRPPGVRRAIAVAAPALMIVVLVQSGFMTVVRLVPHVIREHLLGGQGAMFSGIWPATIIASQGFLDAHRGPGGRPPTLWSTYAGLLEARNGLFQPSTDRIIHALGPAGRAKYVSDFVRARPEVVQTVSPRYREYEAWIESMSWDFYAELLRQYDVFGETPWSLMWERRNTPLAPPLFVWSTTVPVGADSVQLPTVPVVANAPPVVLLQVELAYRTRNPWHLLPIVGSLPRYLVRARGAIQRDAVSIDPYTTTTRFPIVVTRGTAPVLSWRTFSLLPGASLVVTSVEISAVPVSGRDAPWLNALVSLQSGAFDR